MKTFSTFCPSAISCTNPLILPSSSCCRLKYFLLCFPFKRITTNITIKNTTTISDSRILSTIIIITVPKSIMKLWIIIAKLLFIASCTASTSLVKRLINSPCVCASKYRRGSFCTCANKSLRISRMTFCEVFTIKRLYPNVASAPHRYITPIAATARTSPFKSPGTIKRLMTGFKRYVPVILAPALINTSRATKRKDHLCCPKYTSRCRIVFFVSFGLLYPTYFAIINPLLPSGIRKFPDKCGWKQAGSHAYRYRLPFRRPK